MLALPKNFLSDPPELLGGGPESMKARNLFRARHIAASVFDEKGHLSKDLLQKALEGSKAFSLSPYHAYDAPMREWMNKALEDLISQEALRGQIDRFYKPVNLSFGDDLIRLTLDLGSDVAVQEIHARQAALVSLLTYLRQNVGSCFATAPAIRILSQQRELFLKDCQELLATGKMERVVEGVKYAVPLSPNWGLGHLSYPVDRGEDIASSWALLRALESAGIQKGEEFLRTVPLPEIFSFDLLLKKALAHFLHIDDEKMRVIEEQILHHQIHAGSLMPASPEMDDFKARYESAKTKFLATTENALLRSWEYTLSSFSEAKAQFVGWNLYHSLGVDTDQPYGIGEAVFRYLTSKIERLKEELADHQSHYERLFMEAKTLETRVKRGSSLNETDWSLMEYRSRVNEMESVLALRDTVHAKIERLAALYPELMKEYNTLFPDYFQEIYDAGMQIDLNSIFDDSPAGFRLLFKHGRSNPSAWTFIYNSQQFIESLSQFFTMTEHSLLEKDFLKGLEKEFSELISEIILEIRTPLFLEASLRRVSKVHEKGKPWEYVSGGSLTNLLENFYGINTQKQPLKRVIEAPNELLIFIIEAFKDHMPPQTVLATSPTHAFVVTPHKEDFKKSWENSLYTYTWIRDNVLAPRLNFFETTMLNDTEINALIQASPLPRKKDVLEHLSGPLNAFDIMKKVAVLLQNPTLEEHFEAYLYSVLPLFPAHLLQEKVDKVLKVAGIERKEALPETKPGEILTALDLKKALYKSGGVFDKDPYHILALALENEGFIPPRAFIFADTNWTREFFAFHVGLQTAQLELVLSDYTGSSYRPIRGWRPYLDGRIKEPWTLQLSL